MTSPEGSPQLSPQQTAVLALLVTGTPVERAAKHIGVGERTVWRWLSDRELFRQELRSRQREVVEAATRKLSAAASSAVDALKTVMMDEQAPYSARVSAAKAVLDTTYRAFELAEVAQRLEALESAHRGEP